jgi:signal transduction histidine kinase
MRSLRARLVRRTTTAVVVTMTVAAAAVYLWMRVSLLAGLDAALLFEARSLAAHVEQADGQVQLEPEIAALSDYADVAHAHFYQIRMTDRSEALRSPSLGNFDLPLPARPSFEPEYRSLMLPGGTAGRSVAISFDPHVDEDDERAEGEAAVPRVTLAVARDTSALDATLARLGVLLLVVTVAAAAVCVVLTSGVIRRELRPLGSLASSIEQVGIANLAERIDIADCPVELDPVVACLNQLLVRLDAAITREKSFTADVAHELRTPLAGLETTLEVCASRPRDAAGYQSAVTNCLGITRGLHVLVDHLLQLARADARQRVLEPEPVAINDLVQECWSPFAGRAAERELRTEWKLNGATSVPVDRAAARQVLTNLFDNAVTYADQRGQLRTSVVDDADHVAITIANSGCSLDARDASRVFDRFWRGDASRTGAGHHCGLGLSLCRQLVELHQGTITAEIRDGWFSVRLVLPLSGMISDHAKWI